MKKLISCFILFLYISLTNPQTINDPLWSGQDWLRAVNVHQLWISSGCYGSSDVVVAVLGFGVNIYHEDLSSNIWTNNGEKLTENYSLMQNYPNPFNPGTLIIFEIKNTGLVTLKVYDILGKEVKTLIDEIKTPGYYSINFIANNLSSGIYFYTLKTKNYTQTNKMLLLK